jgi:hypothetical protein
MLRHIKVQYDNNVVLHLLPLFRISFTQRHIYSFNRISGIMVSVLVSSAVDRGFKPQLGQIKDYKIGGWFMVFNATFNNISVIFVASLLSTHY